MNAEDLEALAMGVVVAILVVLIFVGLPLAMCTWSLHSLGVHL